MSGDLAGHLGQPAFRDDDGSVDSRLAHARDQIERLAVIGSVRLLIPVVAVTADVPADGDKESQMAAVFTTGADGRRALLAFSCTDTMRSWDPKARPVAVTGRDAARAAVDEGAHALVIDIAEPHMWVVETDDLSHIASGHSLVRTDAGSAWMRGS